MAEVERGITEHVVGGTQRDNMERLVRMRRGGGRPAIVARGAGVVRAPSAHARSVRPSPTGGTRAG
jgi:hypothetical protein